MGSVRLSSTPMVHVMAERAAFDRSVLIKIVRFVAVGLLNTACFFGAFWVFYALFGLERWLSVTLAFVLSTSLQYLGHAKITFDQRARDKAQIFRFVVTVALGYLTTQAIMLVGPGLGIPEFLLGIGVVVGLAVVNWFVFFLWVFNPRDKLST